jgi:hypothetical protein
MLNHPSVGANMTKAINSIDIRKKLLDVSKLAFGLIGERAAQAERPGDRSCSYHSRAARFSSDRIRRPLPKRAIAYLN